MNEKLSRFTKTAGPGILFTSTAIGVSHLIQSTRTGADFGLLIMSFVILAMILKYPSLNMAPAMLIQHKQVLLIVTKNSANLHYGCILF